MSLKRMYDSSEDARALLTERGIPCGECSAFVNAYQWGILCAEKAGPEYKEEFPSPFVSYGDALRCPGSKLYSLWLGAPAHYAARRQESS